MVHRCYTCGKPLTGPGYCYVCSGKSYQDTVQPYVDMMEEMKPEVASMNDAVTKAFIGGIKGIANAISGSKDSPPASPKPAPKVPPSLDIKATTPHEINAAVVDLWGKVYNYRDKAILNTFATRHYAPNYKSEFNGNPGANSRDDAVKSISSGMDKGWTISNPNIVKATADQVYYTYNVGPAICVWNFTFNPVGVMINGCLVTPPSAPPPPLPSGPLSFAISGATPAERNANTILLYARVYNSGDQTLLPRFVPVFYSPSYTSEYNGNPGAVSRDAASSAIAAGMGKGWKLDNVRIVKATEKQVIYSYSVGTSFCTGFVTFNPPGVFFHTILVSVRPQ